jgi:hypothetical protein
MRKLRAFMIMIPLITLPLIGEAGQKWVLEPYLPIYSSQPRGMESGSLLNPYEVRQGSSGRYEIATPFPDSSKPMLSPGQPLNPLELRPIR